MFQFAQSTPANATDRNTMQAFGLVRGDIQADGSWKWTSVVGDKEKMVQNILLVLTLNAQEVELLILKYLMVIFILANIMMKKSL